MFDHSYDYDNKYGFKWNCVIDIAANLIFLWKFWYLWRANNWRISCWVVFFVLFQILNSTKYFLYYTKSILIMNTHGYYTNKSINIQCVLCMERHILIAKCNRMLYVFEFIYIAASTNKVINWAFGLSVHSSIGLCLRFRG